MSLINFSIKKKNEVMEANDNLFIDMLKSVVCILQLWTKFVSQCRVSSGTNTVRV